MTARVQRPVIGIVACARAIDDHAVNVVGEKYIAAIAGGAGALPVLIPALGEGVDPGEIIDRLDGLLLTGSPSNVEPERYGGERSRAGTLHDPARDATTLRLIPAAIAAGLPVLGICRGFQEMNVALGGTLHQRVQEVAGKLDHRSPPDRPIDARYAPVHDVDLNAGGMVADLAGARTLRVNSLHAQGIDRLAPSLAVEAVAPDGLVEAVRPRDAAGFALGVQWHPEWRYREDAFSTALFAAFGAAARKWAQG